MLIRNLIKTADDGAYAARADRSLQTGRVVLVDPISGKGILDVGMINADGDPVYMQEVAFSPQSPPHSQDNVAILRTNSSPYSMVIGAGQVGGANSGQIVTSAGVNSIRKTGETTGQQGDLELEAVGNLLLTRTNKKFSVSEVNTATIGGLQGTGVTLVQSGQQWYYYYNTGVSGNVTFVLPNLILASGGGQAIEYNFVNFSDFNVGVFANTTTYTNFLEDGLASLGIGPGEFFTFKGIQGTGSDGKWRITNHNTSLHTTLTQTGTSYTLGLGDLGRIVAVNNSSPVTVTVPPNSSVKFPLGSLIDVRQIGTGLLTLAAGAGVTLHNSGGLNAIQQYATMTLNKIATDEWIVTNDTYGIAAKRAALISLCEAFTPAGTGVDINERRVPFNPTDGSSITWNVKSIFLRVNAAGGAPVVVIQKSTVGNATFGSGTTVGTITFNSGDFEGEVTTSLGTVTSGDKLRFSVTALGTATGWGIDVLLEAA